MVARRLTKIYTRTGDKGTTALANGSRVDKHHPVSKPWAMWMNLTA